MGRILSKSILTVLVTTWLLTNGGCSRTQERMTTALPGQDVTLSKGQAPTAPIETLIDGETFTAFCDRA